MTRTDADLGAAAARPLTIALAGMFSLAVAMGIGRFAFTPLLPMMLADGAIDLPAASWLASANYFGYLCGTLLCTALPRLWRGGAPVPATRLVHGGLVLTVLTTAAMALPVAAAWPALRFVAGVVTGVVFISTAGWCMAALAQRGASALGAMLFVGPGIGIVASGLAASGMVALGWHAWMGWLAFALLAAGLTALAWPVFRGEAPAPAAAVAAAPRAQAGSVEAALFTLAYSLCGFGYIVTATFLPVIARQALGAAAAGWLDLFWPLLGGAASLGALIATRIPPRLDHRHVLAAACATQALGVVMSSGWPTPAGFALGSALVGLPFTVITFFAMQEARRLRPASAASFMALVTSAYGIGQIVGPPLVATLVKHSASQRAGFAWSLDVAAAALVLAALLSVALARARPRPPN